MIANVTRRNSTALLVLAPAAVLFGALCAIQPYLAAGVLAVALVAAIGLFWPTANLTLLILLTAVVPYDVQNRFGIGGGLGSAGLLPSDALLLMGLAVSALLLLEQRIPARAQVALMGFGAFVVAALLAFVHGILLGRNTSAVGAEFRFLFGYAVLLVALPVLGVRHRRQRFARCLVVIGLLLGLWGVYQWVGHVPISLSQDAGVRPGVLQTTSGRGQVQGGLFGFPIAIILAFAVLLSGSVKSGRGRAALTAVILLNGISLVLTFERTFWVATVFGCLFVIWRAGFAQKIRALLIAPLVIALLLVGLSTVAPGAFKTARERLLSLGQYGDDNSVRYRVVESQHVIDRIKAHPIIGSGLAASIYWGRPWEHVPATDEVFSHNGYLWLAWKLGIPVTMLLIALLAWLVLVRGSVPAGDTWLALRNGAQASIASLFVVSVTFPAFNSLAITPTIGLLAAVIAALTNPKRVGKVLP